VDTAFFISQILSDILGLRDSGKIQIECHIDNKSLWENVHSTKSVNEKRLRIDTASIKQMLEKGELSKIKWVDSSYQLQIVSQKEGLVPKNFWR